MSKSYKEITSRISSSLAKMKKDIPQIMEGFYALSKAANKEGALSVKTKEFIALAIGIATRCDGCIGFHTRTLVNLGVTKEEFLEVLGVATYMGGGPSLMYAADALKAFEEFSEKNA